MQPKYRGHVISRMQDGDTRSTRLYGTYKAAHDAAEKLATRYYAPDSAGYNIDVETK